MKQDFYIRTEFPKMRYYTYVDTNLLLESCIDSKTGTLYVECNLGKKTFRCTMSRKEIQKAIDDNWDFCSDLSDSDQMSQIWRMVVISKWLKA